MAQHAQNHAVLYNVLAPCWFYVHLVYKDLGLPTLWQTAYCMRGLPHLWKNACWCSHNSTHFLPSTQIMSEPAWPWKATRQIGRRLHWTSKLSGAGSQGMTRIQETELARLMERTDWQLPVPGWLVWRRAQKGKFHLLVLPIQECCPKPCSCIIFRVLFSVNLKLFYNDVILKADKNISLNKRVWGSRDNNS